MKPIPNWFIKILKVRLLNYLEGKNENFGTTIKNSETKKVYNKK